eukprot:scaffold7_cov414-Pavlova_lutheri.AAC.13
MEWSQEFTRSAVQLPLVELIVKHRSWNRNLGRAQALWRVQRILRSPSSDEIKAQKAFRDAYLHKVLTAKQWKEANKLGLSFTRDSNGKALCLSSDHVARECPQAKHAVQHVQVDPRDASEHPPDDDPHTTEAIDRGESDPLYASTDYAAAVHDVGPTLLHDPVMSRGPQFQITKMATPFRGLPRQPLICCADSAALVTVLSKAWVVCNFPIVKVTPASRILRTAYGGRTSTYNIGRESIYAEDSKHKELCMSMVVADMLDVHILKG